MLEFIAKYWLEVLFGALVAFIGFSFRSFKNLLMRNIKDREDELKASITKEVDEKFEQHQIAEEKQQEAVQNLQNNLSSLTKGILSMQGKQFRESCEKLLEPTHTITVKEYEQITEDHIAYNGLGGNHNGDALYEAVVEKYKQYL